MENEILENLNPWVVSSKLLGDSEVGSACRPSEVDEIGTPMSAGNSKVNSIVKKFDFHPLSKQI